MSSTARAATGVVLLGGMLVLTGCGEGGGGRTSPVPTVTVQAGGDPVTVSPTQYCRDGEGQRYQVSAPVLEVSPDTTVVLSVADEVAASGWGVQVFDEQLQERIGEVEVADGTVVLDEINTSDVVPATYYLVVVQDADPEACNGLSGAWPIGFIRAGAGTPATSPSSSPTG
ncbi:DUF2771 family protein [Modestobacter sp. VKM Ac-2986]|uniref:DUF2771 family protein n=1 Tax=Modestobacter sp. VKM Ac-2986 TaxID=3004140 RepID=UPI0022AB8F31|nr:DUF2771 family protein [Modestobacter sp. VKM Ac-2986]MCZ2830117.1 DUF2771 family protein [Modestobacter sp. VKM Ac-2986]